MDTIRACLKQLREQRARLDAAITSLEQLELAETTPAPAPKPTNGTPQPRPRRGKRGAKPVTKPNGLTSMSPALTCMQCSPPRKFDKAIGLAQHVSWRHTGRKGAEKSLIGSTLNQ